MSAPLPDASSLGGAPPSPPPDGQAAEVRKPEPPPDVTQLTRSRKLARLQQALRQADSAAILVSPRVLDRVIRRAWLLPAWLWQVPHGDCYVVDRQELFRHVEPDELDLGPDQLLPATVLLLARPSAEVLDRSTGPALLLAYWRRLFHASVHFALHRRSAEGRLTPAVIRARAEAMGPAAFAEVRTVLVQDGRLPERPDDRAVYCEFVAVYLELRYFAPELLAGHFPGLGDLAALDRLVAEDVDGEALFARTRLAGAADPVVPADGSLDESNDYYWKLMYASERAAMAGNSVRAAILRTQAARLAPAALTPRTRALAEVELRRLMTRLRAALQLSDAEAAEWLQDLPALLDKADQGRRPVEAAVLYDLQTVCLDHEREIYTLDVVEWLLSGGHRPIKRLLPGQRLVRIVRHLRSAGQRLARARLSEADRQHLAGLLAAARDRAEERLRGAFRPALTDALRDVGLGPTNPPEQAAFDKLVEELLDRVVVYGFFTFSDLRDAVSRNQLKLPDLAGPQQFIRGDELLRLDRRLATSLDGVYRRSECYLRWLERLGSLNFGTEAGRRVTRYFTLPFGAALLLSEAPSALLHLVDVPVPLAVQLPLFLVLGFFFLGLMHVPALRRGLARVARGVGRALRAVFVDLPARVLRVPILHRLLASWPAQLLWWYVLKPLAICGILWLWWPRAFDTPVAAAAIFVAANVIVNSRLGTATGELIVRSFVSLYEALRAGLLPALVRWILRLFKQLLSWGEWLLFSVDEWLRFRTGDRWPHLVLRAVLGALWFPVSYVLRFAMVVLAEPWINPVKLPICSLIAKSIMPVTAAVIKFSVEHLAEVLGSGLSWVVGYLAGGWLLSAAVTFLFWEMKENWRLYRANRRPALNPVAVGSHGETVRQLLRPGFHSGTVPALFARLRRAEREACVSGKWRTVAAYRHHLAEVEEALRAFVEREMVAVLRQAHGWGGFALAVGRIVLTPNRIAVELVHAPSRDKPVWLEFEERAYWLVAGVREPGWLGELTAEQRDVFTTALAGLYKLAGVELVREQIAANLPAGTRYDVVLRGLAVWAEGAPGPAAVYDLRDGRSQVEPRTPAGEVAKEWPVLPAERVVFARAPLPWDRWLDCWEKDQAGAGHPHLYTAALEPLPAG